MRRIPVSLALAVLLSHSWYPPACCGGHDCKPVPCASVSFVREGLWTVKNPRALGGVAYFSGVPDESPDADCHACQVWPTSAVRCLFLPKETS